MDKRTQDLYRSLVGGSIDFSFRKKMDGGLGIEKNIQIAKEQIRKGVELAFSAGGSICVMLLAELTSFYSKQAYYYAVRPCIEMRRYRPMVLEYLSLSVDERNSRLSDALVKSDLRDKHREAKVEALRYFLSTYSGRASYYRPLLTREEYLIIV